MTLLTAPPISLRRARTAQPQAPVSLHPKWVAKGLVAAYIPAGTSRVGGAAPYTTITRSAGGISVATNSGGPSVDTTSNTFFVIVNMRANSTDSVVLGRVRYNGASNFGAALRFRYGQVEIDFTAGGSGWGYCASDSGGVQAGRHSYAGRHLNNQAGDTFRDGVKLSQFAVSFPSGAPIVAFDGAIDIGHGTASGATAITGSIDGTVEIGLHFTSYLSDADIAELHRNPYQALVGISAPTFNLARGREPVSVRESMLLPASGPIKSLVEPVILGRRKSWVQQPPQRPTIDWSSSLAQGLLFHAPLHPQWGMVDLVSGSPAVRTGLAAQGVNKYGALPLFGASNYADFTVPPTLDGNKPVTIAWVQQPRSPSAYGTILNIRPAVNAGNAFLIYTSVTASNGYTLAIGNRNGAGCLVHFDSTVGPLVDGKLDYFVATIAGGMNDLSGSLLTTAVWRNGVKLAPGGNSSFGANANASFRIGALDSAGDPFEGLLGGITIWQRIPSDDECRRMSTRPQSLYTPQTQHIWGTR